MSNAELRPHINQPSIAPDYSSGNWHFGLWLLVVAAAVCGIFALMFFADGGGSIDPEHTPITAPASAPTHLPSLLGE